MEKTRAHSSAFYFFLGLIIFVIKDNNTAIYNLHISKVDNLNQ
jgi:hypothetical protein